jgi:protein gp37
MFHPERLAAPKNTKVPQDGPGERNVFVCSMADLFGDWVPQEWIESVLKTIRESPDWTFLFLTKNPARLVDIKWPENAWVGTTVDTQARVKPAEEAFKKIKAEVKFVSLEPLKEKVKFSHPEYFNWFIIGGQSASTGEPAFQPEWNWVESLVDQARSVDAMVYFKPNLETRPKEYPR